MPFVIKHLFYSFICLFSLLNGQNQSQFYSLRLFILIPSDGCLSPNGLFDFTASIQDSISLNTQTTVNWALNNNSIEQYLIPLSECKLTNSTFNTLLTTHSKAQQLANTISLNNIYYTVIVGPYNLGLCDQMNQLVLIPYMDCMKPRSTYVYHTSFQCPPRRITYQLNLLPNTTMNCFNTTNRNYHDFTNIASLHIGASKYQVSLALVKILKHLNRLDVLIVYQDDDDINDQSGVFANYLAYLMTQAGDSRITIREIHGWHVGKNVSSVLRIGSVNYSVCIVIAQLAVYSNFLTDIYQWNPSILKTIMFIAYDMTLFSYDVLKVWRSYAAPNDVNSIMNSAFVLTSHPYGSKLQLTNDYLNQKDYLAMKLTLGMAISTFKHHVQQQLQQTSVVQGSDGFYASLKNTTLRIPVRSDLSLAVTFNQYPEQSQAALDFYLINTYTCDSNSINATSATTITTCIQVYSTMIWPDYNVSTTLLMSSWQLAASLQQGSNITNVYQIMGS
uniref:ANF_receptor domain-containing protein n=1 Tax=Trichobilharzia regenti TaxID=157069 RepID=A0AA85JXG3_TRIRE|nr:unnamed protein product [Trichobilharzia regenti]